MDLKKLRWFNDRILSAQGNMNFILDDVREMSAEDDGYETLCQAAEQLHYRLNAARDEILCKIKQAK